MSALPERPRQAPVTSLLATEADAAHPSVPPFTPPPRFGTVGFEAFEARHPSQAVARERVAAFAADAARSRSGRWPWSAPRAGRGLYLDGGFGVGKTHLLAAAWHAAPVPPARKRYLSFQELVYLLGLPGSEAARDAFRHAALVCLDEFELDDPGNTLIVKRFLTGVLDGGADVLTTSNTPPAAQGAGRFNADDFRREIQAIASRFEVVAVDGPDHRQGAHAASFHEPAALRTAAREGPAPVVRLAWTDLLEELARWHPIRYRQVLDGVGTLLIDDVRTLDGLNDALRFVHFLDKAYDLRVRLRATGRVPLRELFHPSYREGAFARKFDRCASRMAELLGEPLT